MRETFRFTPQAVLGLVIVYIGVLLTLDNLHVAQADWLLRFWPIGIVAAGVVQVLQSSTTSGRVFGGIIMLLGVIWSGRDLFGLSVDVGDLWPLALIALGVIILTRARSGRDDAAPAAGSDASISEVAIWAGKQRRNVSPGFRRGDLTAIMGGIEIDLRGASTATGESVIDVFVLWGGIEIWVPPDWAVSNQALLLMGGAEDKSTGTQDARHRLIVRGVVVMGGLEIKT